MNSEKITRNFIGAKRSPEIPSKPELIDMLPKDPDELTHSELLDRFRELVVRCFNSENQLDVAKKIIEQQNVIIKKSTSTIPS